MFDPLTLQIATGVMLGILSAACLLGLVRLFVGTKGINEAQHRSRSAVLWSLLILGVSLAVFLISQRLMGTHGMMMFLNPFLIPVVIMAKVLVAEISKPRHQGH